MINKNIQKKGFSLLFASLVGGLVLAIGAAILNVTVKQITLASAGRESQYAFYSADSGLECALYLDRGGNNEDAEGSIFRKPVDGSASILGFDENFPYVCNGEPVVFDSFSSDGDFNNIYKFSIVQNAGATNKICFSVKLIKQDNQTKIESRGLNTCNQNSGRLFERAIYTEY